MFQDWKKSEEEYEKGDGEKWKENIRCKGKEEVKYVEERTAKLLCSYHFFTWILEKIITPTTDSLPKRGCERNMVRVEAKLQGFLILVIDYSLYNSKEWAQSNLDIATKGTDTSPDGNRAPDVHPYSVALLNELSRLKGKLSSFNVLCVRYNVAFSNKCSRRFKCHLRRFNIRGIPSINTTYTHLFHLHWANVW
jgi:hypothetical protein